MLEEMRGQTGSMKFIVHKVCATRHKQQIEIHDLDALTWSGDAQGASIYYSGAEYVATSGRFRFSPKDCKDSADDDFYQAEEGVAARENGPIVVLFPGGGTADPKCMKTLNLRGHYR